MRRGHCDPEHTGEDDPHDCIRFNPAVFRHVACRHAQERTGKNADQHGQAKPPGQHQTRQDGMAGASHERPALRHRKQESNAVEPARMALIR